MIRVLIVDDQEMIRVGLRAILETQANITVVGEAGDGLEAVRLLRGLAADVVLMDIRMPGVDGVEATRRIRQTIPAERVRIIILTTFDHDETVFAALRAGANGFLSKGVGPAELAAGIEEVAAGGGALSATAAAALIDRVAEERQADVDPALADLFSTLTPKEHDVVIAIATGLSNQQIAETMFISPYTVKTHANRAMAKVGARDRAQLVAYAYRAGLGS
ncbi:response regulator transcription factor [Arthrobacter sp. B2a2-09]|uniref:response regulator transcription factor n=1 Tax=Arthrobacter sp. B2a2-09 TaxID=2952822 RepID=UPI0022CD44EC|nr:response regulator transcription factor [Arthrobacter sp. B2a2-09]MCZ9882808.1 response regulator transcription factor [Arthrobacter sp. B2a2-09]